MTTDFATWRETTCDAVVALAETLGWSVESRRMAGTGSTYITFERWGTIGQDEDGDDMDASDKLVVRVADHGTCYDSEDLSLDFAGGGHLIEQVSRALALPRGAWSYTPRRDGSRRWSFPQLQPLAD